MSTIESITISRQETRPFDYATLRQEAIELSQKLSGKIWTDYNVHDPGVTILEQIVFSLTELGYKTGFDIEDYLCSPDGSIDYESQALFDSSLVTQAFPVSLDEYSAFFKAHVFCKKPQSNLRCYPENVHFSVDEKGFYKVVFSMSGTFDEWVSDCIFKGFWTLWRKWRCMGDHVSDIRINWMGGEFNFVESNETVDDEILPRGDHHDLMFFSPIIDLFPTIYREGASAKPLKKYLAPIEFVFKKFTHLMDYFPQLFSVRGNLSEWASMNRSYSAQAVKRNLERYDQALNQMLAMFGVRFPKFDYISLPRLVRCKVQFLRELPKLLQYRSGISWHRRIELMLGVLHDDLDKLKIFNIDGIFANEKAGRVHLVIFYGSEFDLETICNIECFICNEIPAHLLPIVYWVPKKECRIFSEIFSEWENYAPINPAIPPRIMEWLDNHKEFISNRVWL